jgi:hydroxymethylbilane synthase
VFFPSPRSAVRVRRGARGVNGVPQGGASRLRLGSRGSALALAQAAIVADRLRARFPQLAVEVVPIRTEGDLDQVSPLTEIGGRGVFTSALEAAVLRGEIDAAVHSAKDLPSTLHPDAPLAAFPDRDDPRDVLVSRDGLPLDRLPFRPLIGTSSRRREVQIRLLRPDARTASIRGNIDTRLGKVAAGEYDAIVLAAAGLRRMGWGERITQVFSVEELIPAPAQAALAVQARAGSAAAAMLAAVDDPTVAVPVRAERAFLAALGAGCAIPVGAYAGDGTRFLAMVAGQDGGRIERVDTALAPGQEEAQAAEIGACLLAAVGIRSERRVWNGWQTGRRELEGARVVVTRPRAQAAPLLDALAARGAEAIACPAIRVQPVVDTSALDAALGEAAAGRFPWIVFTSRNAVDAVAARLLALGLTAAALAGVQVAAVGPVTADAASRIGLDVVAVPTEADADHLAALLRARVAPGERVLYPRSASGRDTVPSALRGHGAQVEAIAVYLTVCASDGEAEVVSRIRRRAFDVVTFASPSSVVCFARLFDDDPTAIGTIAAICAGPVTARAAREAGFRVAAIAADPGAEAICEAVAEVWRNSIAATDQRAEAERHELTAGRSTS